MSVPFRGKLPYITPVIFTDATAFRPNVAAIVQEPEEGRILVCERLDYHNAWQFPQGGLEKKEVPEEGLQREVLEEISLEPTDYRVVEQRGPYRYLFFKGRARKGFQGQEQYYFRLELLAPRSRVNVHTPRPEFRSVQWIEPAEFQLSWLPEIKREVYQQVFQDFFGVELR